MPPKSSQINPNTLIVGGVVVAGLFLLTREGSGDSALGQVGNVASGIGQGAEGLGSGFGNFFEGLGDLFTGIGGGVGSAVSGAGSGVGSAASGIGSGLEGLGSGIGNVFEGFGSGFENVGEGVSNIGTGISSVANATGDLVTSVSNAPGNIVSGIVDPFTNFISAFRVNGANRQGFNGGVLSNAVALFSQVRSFDGTKKSARQIADEINTSSGSSNALTQFIGASSVPTGSSRGGGGSRNTNTNSARSKNDALTRELQRRQNVINRLLGRSLQSRAPF